MEIKLIDHTKTPTLRHRETAQQPLETIRQQPDEQVILDLTLYELGNIILKETHTTEEATKRAKALEKITNIMQIHRINPNDLTAITENSSKHNLTFYDSAYLTIAQTQNTTLVTEDQQLLKAAQQATHPATQLQELLKQ